MGLIQSVICSITFCVERILMWTCCAFVLMLLMFTIILLMIYGISVGYHYAQRELAHFALTSRTLKKSAQLPSGPESQPVLRLDAVNRSELENAPRPILEVYQTKKPHDQVYLETQTETTFAVLETERPSKEPELSPREQALAGRLISRFRRSRSNIITTRAVSFLRTFNYSVPAFPRSSIAG